jgi:hypothetical protein
VCDQEELDARGTNNPDISPKRGRKQITAHILQKKLRAVKAQLGRALKRVAKQFKSLSTRTNSREEELPADEAQGQRILECILKGAFGFWTLLAIGFLVDP